MFSLGSRPVHCMPGHPSIIEGEMAFRSPLTRVPTVSTFTIIVKSTGLIQDSRGGFEMSHGVERTIREVVIVFVENFELD